MACLVVTAVAFYAYSPYLSITAAPSGPRPATAGSSGASTASDPSPTAPSPSGQAPDGDRARDPGRSSPGVRLVATVLAKGVFEVTETVRLPAPVAHLTLAPPDLHAASGDLRSARPVATQLEVRVAGKRVRLAGRTVRRSTTIRLDRAASRFEIRYELHGSVRVNHPSSSGRALGAVAPLLRRQPGDLPVAVIVHGEAVRNLGCVAMPVDQQACFAGERPNARVNRNLPLRAALVQVQLDLKAAAGEGER